jgi:hypothetical protein
MFRLSGFRSEGLSAADKREIQHQKGAYPVLALGLAALVAAGVLSTEQAYNPDRYASAATITTSNPVPNTLNGKLDKYAQKLSEDIAKFPDRSHTEIAISQLPPKHIVFLGQATVERTIVATTPYPQTIYSFEYTANRSEMSVTVTQGNEGSPLLPPVGEPYYTFLMYRSRSDNWIVSKQEGNPTGNPDLPPNYSFSSLGNHNSAQIKMLDEILVQPLWIINDASRGYIAQYISDNVGVRLVPNPEANTNG